MNLKQKAITSVFWSAIQNWGSQAISFAVFALLARLLAPESFGLIALAGVFLAFVEVFLNRGFSTAIIQRQELETEHLDTAFWTNIAIGCLMAIITIFSANLIAVFFKEAELAPIIRWLSLSFFINSLSGIQEANFRRNLAFKPLAIRSLTAVTVGGIIGISMAVMGFGVWSLVGQMLGNSFTQVIVLWRASDWQPKLRFSYSHFQDLFSFGIYVIGINLLNFFNRRSDDLLIGYFLGSKALGYYTIAYKILLVMTQLLTSIISNCALPLFSTLQQEPEKFRNAYYKCTQLSSLIAFPAFLGVAASAPEIILICFGEQWSPSIPVMQVLAFIGIQHSLTYFNGTVMMAMGKVSWRLKLQCFNSLANIIGFAIAVNYGITAVAAAYVIRGYLIMPIALWIVKQLIQINYGVYFNQLRGQIMGTTAVVITVMSARYLLQDLINNQSCLLAIYLTLGVILYGLIINFVSPNLSREIVQMSGSTLAWKKNSTMDNYLSLKEED